MNDDKTLSWFNRKGLTPPEHISHDISLDDISKKLKPLKPHSWRLEGNKLIAKTDVGELVNYIPTNYILVGTDKQGLPKFEEIK